MEELGDLETPWPSLGGPRKWYNQVSGELLPIEACRALDEELAQEARGPVCFHPRRLPMLITVKTYDFPSATDPGYVALRAKLEARGLPLFNVNAMSGEPRVPAGTYDVDPSHLFNNQVNTVATDESKGWRVFDWYEGIHYSHNGRPTPRRAGHYIEAGEGYDALQQARREQFACGYCGARYHLPDFDWCTKCRGSQYLKPADFPLLRLRPVSEHNPDRSEQPPADVLASIGFDHAAADRKRVLAHVERFREENEEKAARRSLELRFRELCAEAGLTMRDLSNLIAYSKPKTTDLRFTFGWRDREPFTADDAERIKAALARVNAGAFDVEYKVR